MCYMTHKICDTKHYKPIQLYKYKHTIDKLHTINNCYTGTICHLEFFIYPYFHFSSCHHYFLTVTIHDTLLLEDMIDSGLERISCLGFLVY